MHSLNIALFFALLAICASHVYFRDDFSNANWESRWVVSDWKRDKGEAGDWGLSAGKYFTDESKERGLKTLQDARFYDISSKHEDFSNKGKTFIIQLSVKHEQGIDCGGGYVKLVPADGLSDQKDFKGGESETKYNIMFGPDICGYTKKVHFILNRRGTNHLIKEDVPAESDEFTHVYTGVLNPDNTFKIYVDGAEKKSGAIPDFWNILPPKKINDPAESKPADWVDDRLIDDPEDKNLKDGTISLKKLLIPLPLNLKIGMKISMVNGKPPKSLILITKDPGALKKLTILPIKDHGYTLKLITRIIKTILNFMLLILLSISALMYGKLNLEPSLAISF